MQRTKQLIINTFEYVEPFFKWLLFGVLMGALGGVVGSFFHKCLDIVTETRTHHKWLLLLLPLAGLLITALYQLFRSKGKLNTNRVLDAAETDERVPLTLSPLIFVSTLLSHLFGASAGREGAALQLGGSIGYNIGRLFRLNKSDRHIIVMVGMSSFFSAMFGAPLTAAIFALEVIRVGYVRHCGFMPCIVSAVVAYETAVFLGVHGVRYSVAVPSASAILMVQVIVLSVLCALVSIVFCVAIKNCSVYMHRFFHNPYIRTMAGSLIIIALACVFGTMDYNGAGMEVIDRAMAGEAVPYAFILKIVFTAITIAAGFKGGEIVPTLFIGATFGCAMSTVLGLDPAFGASVGFVALFCGVVNCPFASVALALEVFGAQGILIYAVVCAVSFMMSGNFSIYKSQKIVFSKVADERIEENTQ